MFKMVSCVLFTEFNLCQAIKMLNLYGIILIVPTFIKVDFIKVHIIMYDIKFKLY